MCVALQPPATSESTDTAAQESYSDSSSDESSEGRKRKRRQAISNVANGYSLCEVIVLSTDRIDQTSSEVRTPGCTRAYMDTHSALQAMLQCTSH